MSMNDFFCKGQLMEGWKNPASEVQTCLGEVQCPTCDTIMNGAIQHVCGLCDQPLFPIIAEVIKNLKKLKEKCPELEESIKMLEQR